MINLTTSELTTMQEILENFMEEYNGIPEYKKDMLKVIPLRRKIQKYLEGISGAKQKTKEIKATATKLPKKNLKLEDVLRELR